MSIFEIVKKIPSDPGVYYMISNKSEIIYIGKAKNLNKRVSSYFNLNEKSSKIETMILLIFDIKYQICKNEIDALTLEAKEINLHQPKYNTLLKDDKSFYFIVISEDEYPLIEIVHEKNLNRNNKNSFGPFLSKYHAQKIIELIRKITKFRTCSNANFSNRTRPCLDFHIKLCSAPCVNKISKESYRQVIENTILLLLNNKKDLIEQLENKMNKLIEETKFEEAIVIREQMQNIYRIVRDRDLFEIDNTDIFIIDCERKNIKMAIIRHSKNYGNREIKFDDQEELERILVSLYLNRLVPDKIIIKSNSEILTGNINSILLKKNKLLEIKTKDFDNHEVKSIDRIIKSMKLVNENDRDLSLNYLKELIDIGNVNRIEILDNSHNQGSNAISVIVVADNGGFLKNEYKKIEYQKKSNDDYIMMYNIVEERFKLLKLNLENKPDLIIVDGGIGQIGVVKKVIKEYGIFIPIIGISKGEKHDDGNDTIVLEDGRKIQMKSNDKRLHYFQTLRDEAHRFAITKYRKKHQKENLKSSFDTINGIGKEKKKKLLISFGNISNIKNATAEELRSVKGIGDELAKKIKNSLSNEE